MKGDSKANVQIGVAALGGDVLTTLRVNHLNEVSSLVFVRLDSFNGLESTPFNVQPWLLVAKQCW